MNEINLEYNTRVSVVYYKSLGSRLFKSFSMPKWSKLVNKLSVLIEANCKYVRGVAVHGDIEDNTNDHGEIIKKRRNDKDVIYRNVIVPDYDEINDLKQLHDAISSALSSVAWYWYISSSHTTEQARIHLYIPLNERINADDYRKYAKVLANKIGHKTDEGLYQPGRCFALPVIQKEHIFIERVNDCSIIDVDMLEQWSKESEQPNGSPNIKGYTRRDSVYWRNTAPDVSEGEHNSTLASITDYLSRKYVDPNLVYGLVSAWVSVCKPLIDQSEVSNTFKSISKKDSRNS